MTSRYIADRKPSGELRPENDTLRSCSAGPIMETLIMVDDTGNQVPQFSLFGVAGDPANGLMIKLPQVKTAAEAIKTAGLDWQVVKKPISVVDGEEGHWVKDKYGVVRQDLWDQSDCPVFGIVGKNYTPLQNLEAFSFFDPIVEKGKATYEVAGMVGQGERIWILAKMPDSIQITSRDTVHKYLLLSNSHDGNSSVQIKFTPYRVWCENMLTMALSRGPTMRVSHFRDLHARLENAELMLQKINKHYEEIEKQFRKMLKVRMDEARLTKYVTLVFPAPRDPEDEKARDRVDRDREFSQALLYKGARQPGGGCRGDALGRV